MWNTHNFSWIFCCDREQNNTQYRDRKGKTGPRSTLTSVFKKGKLITSSKNKFYILIKILRKIMVHGWRSDLPGKPTACQKALNCANCAGAHMFKAVS